MTAESEPPKLEERRKQKSPSVGKVACSLQIRARFKDVLNKKDPRIYEKLAHEKGDVSDK